MLLRFGNKYKYRVWEGPGGDRDVVIDYKGIVVIFDIELDRLIVTGGYWTAEKFLGMNSGFREIIGEIHFSPSQINEAMERFFAKYPEQR